MAFLVAAGCSSARSAARHADAPSTTTTTVALITLPTTTTIPVSTSPLVKSRVRELLASWDAGLTAALRDPRSVAGSSDLSTPAALTASFTADSPYLRTLGAFVRQGYVDSNRGERAGADGTVQKTTLLRITQRPDADHVSFVFCTYNDGIDFVLSTGKALPATVGIVQGTGEARRTPDGWRLHLLQQLSAVDRPAGTRNPCPGLAEK
jgi:hypothetical protein